MRVKFWQPAEEHERYMPHAFDKLIGQTAPFKISGVEHGRATVIAVEVAEDGTGATWTVDVPDDAAGPLNPQPDGRAGGSRAVVGVMFHRWHRNPWAHFRCAQCFIARWRYAGERLGTLR